MNSSWYCDVDVQLPLVEDQFCKGKDKEEMIREDDARRRMEE